MNAAQNELGLIGLIKAFQVDVSKAQSLVTFLDRIDFEHSDVEGLVNAIVSFNPKTFIDKPLMTTKPTCPSTMRFSS